MHRFVDRDGKVITLGRELGRGGEGAVFEIAGQSSYVAKVYSRRVSAVKRDKLSAMVQSTSQDILKFAAWPVTTLHGNRGRDLVGFVMPRITANDIHQLYSPAQRKTLFPSADWAFLLRTARNCAAAISTLHSNGIVVGDINQGNAQVSQDALVNFIDCDSFQLQANGRTYLCEVGVGHFTPPELQSAKFDRVIRTPNHDCFGLALLIFHLLFMGRHPFAGRYAGKGDMPIERAISEYRFAYSVNVAASQMSPPPFTLSTQVLPADIVTGFEKAFGRGSDQPGARPTAEAWVKTLDTLQERLRKCTRDPAHVFPSNARCPWCEIENAGGPPLFISVSIRRTLDNAPQIDVDAVWVQIANMAFPDPGASRASQRTTVQVTPKALPIGTRDSLFLEKLALLGAACGGVVLLLSLCIPLLLFPSILICTAFVCWWYVQRSTSPLYRIRTQRKKLLVSAKAELVAMQRRADSAANSDRSQFQEEWNRLASIKAQIASLGSERATAIQNLQAAVRERQFAAHLESSFIANARIEGIGATRISTLSSYGIETAADIKRDAILTIPGFGPSLSSRLLAWRSMVEGRFHFDPARGVPKSEIMSVETHYVQRRITLERQLHAGPKNLKSILNDAVERIQKHDMAIRAIELKVTQANADWNASR